MPLHHNDWTLFHVLLVVSLSCSIGVIILSLFNNGSSQATSTRLRLLVWLHVIVIIEGLASIPKLYGHIDALCEAIAFVHMYVGLAYVLIVGFLIWLHKSYCNGSQEDFDKWFRKYGAPIVFGVPLVALLPFVTNSYANADTMWCAMKIDTFLTDFWEIALCYMWAWLVLLLGTFSIVYEVYKSYRQIEPFKSFWTIGMYCVIAICVWVPCTLARFSHVFGSPLGTGRISFYYAYMTIFVAGILCAIVFVRGMRDLLEEMRLSEQAARREEDVVVPNRLHSLSSPESSGSFSV